MLRLAAGTIASKSCFAAARVVAASFREHHPGIPFFVLLCDEVEGCFDPSAEPFSVIPIPALGIPGWRTVAFRWGEMELSCAATPWLLAHLLARGFDGVLFFKQESLVLGDFTPVAARLERHPILLTPHFTAPPAGEEAVERELAVILAGAYNVGFLAVAAAPEARRFLAWWGERTMTDCRHAVGEGLHYEQRWLNLVPGYFAGVHLVREPGANVGHWNLPERRIEVVGDEVRVDGEPGRLMRFSGYDRERPERATRYFDRLRVSELGAAADLFARYGAALAAAGDETTRAWPYAFGRFADGVAIPEVARELYRELGADAARFGDPFAGPAPGSFRAHLAEPIDSGAPPISRLWDAVYRRRPDVGRAYPEPLGRDRAGFLAWTRSSGAREHAIAPQLVREGEA
ncbi:MAG: hypothetical protein U0X73_12425 [Thermoanaerobaculia bacterium]